MLKTRMARAGLVVTALSVAGLAGGTAYGAFSSPGVTATDTVEVHGSGTFLSPLGGVETPIMSVSLAEGNYVLTADGNLVNFGPSDYARCQIVVNGTQIAATSTVVGDSIQSGNVGSSDLLASVALVGGVRVGPYGALAVVQCDHDRTQGARPYFDNLGSMWVHQTRSLEVLPSS